MRKVRQKPDAYGGIQSDVPVRSAGRSVVIRE